MAKNFCGKNRLVVFAALVVVSAVVCLSFCGCGASSGYSSEWLHSRDVSSVYVEMFDNKSFRRSVEYELTDALAKRIEAETPYKVISSRDRAETILSGEIISITTASFASERQTGRPLEQGVQIRAEVTWKNLKTGEMIIEDKIVSAASSYSEWQNQGFDYASALAANRLAQRIVELMEQPW